MMVLFLLSVFVNWFDDLKIVRRLFLYGKLMPLEYNILFLLCLPCELIGVINLKNLRIGDYSYRANKWHLL